MASVLLLGHSYILAQDEAATVLIVPGAENNAILADADGWLLYAWAGDIRGISQCYGACAEVWPPALTDGDITAPDGLPGALGMIDRGDGAWQLTLEGWPLYTFAGDEEPGDANGHGVVDFGSEWHVVSLGIPAPPRVAAQSVEP